MSDSLVSIITVCFNSASTIKDTIESVLNQTYQNIEYILIDGNSTDKTVEIIKSYEQRFKEKKITYKWISEIDKGIYDAMNKGVSMASGDIIGIIGSDDWYELDGINHIINQYKIAPSDYLHGNITTYSSSKRLLKYIKAGSKKEMIKRMSFYHPASFIKKEVYKALGGYSLDYTICSDYDFILRILKNEYSITHVDKNIVNFSYGGVSTSRVKEALFESHIVRVNNGFNKFLSIWYYYRALFINKTKKIFLDAY